MCCLLLRYFNFHARLLYWRAEWQKLWFKLAQCATFITVSQCLRIFLDLFNPPSFPQVFLFIHFPCLSFVGPETAQNPEKWVRNEVVNPSFSQQRKTRNYTSFLLSKLLIITTAFWRTSVYSRPGNLQRKKRKYSQGFKEETSFLSVRKYFTHSDMVNDS